MRSCTSWRPSCSPNLLVRRGLLSFVLFCLLAAPTAVLAMPVPVVIVPEQGSYPLAKHLELLEDPRPACTYLVVAGLADPDYLVEIDVVASRRH